jgi:hypothetical protein
MIASSCAFSPLSSLSRKSASAASAAGFHELIQLLREALRDVGMQLDDVRLLAGIFRQVVE